MLALVAFPVSLLGVDQPIVGIAGPAIKHDLFIHRNQAASSRSGSTRSKAGKARFLGFTGHKSPRIHLKMARHRGATASVSGGERNTPSAPHPRAVDPTTERGAARETRLSALPYQDDVLVCETRRRPHHFPVMDRRRDDQPGAFQQRGYVRLRERDVVFGRAAIDRAVAFLLFTHREGALPARNQLANAHRSARSTSSSSDRRGEGRAIWRNVIIDVSRQHVREHRCEKTNRRLGWIWKT